MHYNLCIEHWPSKTAAQRFTAEDAEGKRKANSFTVNLQRYRRRGIFFLPAQRQNCSSNKCCSDCTSFSFSLSIGITKKKKKIPKLGIQIKEYNRSARLHSVSLWQFSCSNLFWFCFIGEKRKNNEPYSLEDSKRPRVVGDIPIELINEVMSTITDPAAMLGPEVRNICRPGLLANGLFSINVPHG